MLSTVFKAVGSLPLGVLYALSGTVSFLAGRVVGYRRKVIRRNLRESFPDMPEAELKRVERKFYGFLGDYFVETLRLGRMSEKEIRRRMVFENADEVARDLEQGHNVSLVLGHTGNWEWLSSIPLHLPEGFHAGQVYHPLENRDADRAFYELRSHFGAENIAMRDVLPTVMNWRKEGKPFIIGYIADQSPQHPHTHVFVDFLNHDTPAMTGHERISRMLHASVYYCDISRPERGKYVCRYVKITDDAASLPMFEMTRRYYELLEANIRRSPHLWLWSHKRWKRTRESFFAEFGEEEGNKRLSHL